MLPNSFLFPINSFLANLFLPTIFFYFTLREICWFMWLWSYATPLYTILRMSRPLSSLLPFSFFVLTPSFSFYIKESTSKENYAYAKEDLLLVCSFILCQIVHLNVEFIHIFLLCNESNLYIKHPKLQFSSTLTSMVCHEHFSEHNLPSIWFIIATNCFIVLKVD